MQVCLDIHSCIHLFKYTCSHAMHTQACVHVQVCQRTLTSVDMACRHALIRVYTHVEPTHILEPPQSQPRPRELSPSVWVPRDPGEVTPVCRKSHCTSTHHPQLLAWYNGGSHSTQLCLLSLCFPISYTLIPPGISPCLLQVEPPCPTQIWSQPTPSPPAPVLNLVPTAGSYMPALGPETHRWQAECPQEIDSSFPDGACITPAL